MIFKKRAFALSVAALVVVAVAAGGAVASFPQDNVKLYTGCLTSGGSLANVAEGDNPLQPCSTPKQVVKLSGGDITSLTVTAPLTGGGTNGALTIGLDASATLPTCSANNAVPKWNLATSRWTCGTDNDTTYSAGTGLALSGTQFNIASDYRVKNTPDCDSGKFATGFDGDGNIQCAAPAAANLETIQGYASQQGIPDTNLSDHTLVSISPPAGKYLVIADGTITSENNLDSGSSVKCFVTNSGDAGFFVAAFSPLSSDTLNAVDEVPFSIEGVTTVAAGATLALKCNASQGADGVGANADIVALKIG